MLGDLMEYCIVYEDRVELLEDKNIFDLIGQFSPYYGRFD
jgi:hypothetical protein